MKLQLITVAALLVLLSGQQLANAQFSDIQKDSLTFLYDHSFIDGYADGTFKPTVKVNRAELMKMIMSAAQAEVTTPAANCFPDVPKTEWYAPYICTAKDQGWIEGYPDGKFYPEKTVNKVEALKIMAKIEKWEVCDAAKINFNPPASLLKVTDVDLQAWYYPYLCAAYSWNYVDPLSRFYPTANYTRGDIAEIVFRVLIDDRMANISEYGLGLVARDFFKVNEYLAGLTFSVLDATKIVTQFKAANGDIYFFFPDLNYKLASPLELEDAINKALGSDNLIHVHAILWFGANQKMKGYSWFLTASASHTGGYVYTIDGASGSKVDYSEKFIYSSGIDGLTTKKVLMLDQVR
jgi:hypothetical protein